MPPVVGALKVNRALRELHLTNNLLNSYQDALQLGDLLRYNTTLRTLELSRNAVADAGNMLMILVNNRNMHLFKVAQCKVYLTMWVWKSPQFCILNLPYS